MVGVEDFTWESWLPPHTVQWGVEDLVLEGGEEMDHVNYRLGNDVALWDDDNIGVSHIQWQ